MAAYRTDMLAELKKVSESERGISKMDSLRMNGCWKWWKRRSMKRVKAKRRNFFITKLNR